jgi:2-keto-4-pentenoate hydratase/2-oxohepta-3-ene-1,7-dioic acid hydratase in catechol pathway
MRMTMRMAGLGGAIMKLVTYSKDGLPPRVGAVVETGIVDLGGREGQFARQMIDIIAGGRASLEEIKSAVLSDDRIPLSSVRLLAPVPHPPEFIIVGGNYRDHLGEASIPDADWNPIFTNKQTSCVAGPYDDVVLPRVSEQLDYEGELGIVIGQAARNLSPEEAAGAIFGYVVVNDLSVRDWQFRSPTHTLGKSFDTHGPFGPWIVTADEVPDPNKLVITTKVNEEVRQHGTTADMIFDCRRIVAYLSSVMTLQPGTVIATGTMAGVGLFHNPPAFLCVGDVVAVEISGIGRLSNRVIAEVTHGAR